MIKYDITRLGNHFYVAVRLFLQMKYLPEMLSFKSTIFDFKIKKKKCLTNICR